MTSLTRTLDRPRAAYLADLLRELVARDIKLRYKRSVLGILWSLITPLAQLLVLTFLFGRVVPLNIPNYTSFVFSGVLAWAWFQNSLYLAASAITGNRELVRRPGFPVSVLPVVTVATNLIHYLLGLPVLLLFLLIDGGAPGVNALALPLLIVIQFLLTLSIAYVIAAIQVTFRDTQHLMSLALMLMFYITPVFYRATAVPEAYQWLYLLNPMAHLIDAYRAVLIQGRLPTLLPLLLIAAGSCGLLGLGYTIFTQASHRFAEEL